MAENNYVGSGETWANEVELIVRKVMNGGSHCTKGQLNARAIDGLEKGLQNEREERREEVDKIFSKLDEIKNDTVTTARATGRIMISGFVSLLVVILGGIVLFALKM